MLSYLKERGSIDFPTMWTQPRGYGTEYELEIAGDKLDDREYSSMTTVVQKHVHEKRSCLKITLDHTQHHPFIRCNSLLKLPRSFLLVSNCINIRSSCRTIGQMPQVFCVKVAFAIRHLPADLMGLAGPRSPFVPCSIALQGVVR